MLVLAPRFIQSHREKRLATVRFSEFTNFLIQGNFDQAYKLCGTDFRNAMPYEQFENQQHSFGEMYGRLDSVRVAGYELLAKGTPADWKASFNADFVYAAKTVRFVFELRKEGEQWYVYGYREL
jgi:hypothetical protein